MLKAHGVSFAASALVAGLLAFGGHVAWGAGPIVTVDGSSTVFPITEAVAEEFQKEKKGAVRGYRRHIGHGWRIQEVLPRRDRHL